MPKDIYVRFLTEQPNASIHFLNRLVKVLNQTLDYRFLSLAVMLFLILY